MTSTSPRRPEINRVISGRASGANDKYSEMPETPPSRWDFMDAEAIKREFEWMQNDRD